MRIDQLNVALICRSVVLAWLCALCNSTAADDLSGSASGQPDTLPPQTNSHYRVCAARCVNFLLDYFEVPSHNDVYSIARDFPEGLTDGVALGSLVDELRKLGFTANAVTTRDLLSISRVAPAILLLRPAEGEAIGHYVVLLGTSAVNNVTVWDGLHGVKQMNLSAVMTLWTGHAVIIGETGYYSKTTMYIIEICSLATILGVPIFLLVTFRMRCGKPRPDITCRHDHLIVSCQIYL
jgi:hypothetical protein